MECLSQLPALTHPTNSLSSALAYSPACNSNNVAVCSLQSELTVLRSGRKVAMQRSSSSSLYSLPLSRHGRIKPSAFQPFCQASSEPSDDDSSSSSSSSPPSVDGVRTLQLRPRPLPPPQPSSSPPPSNPNRRFENSKSAGTGYSRSTGYSSSSNGSAALQGQRERPKISLRPKPSPPSPPAPPSSLQDVLQKAEQISQDQGSGSEPSVSGVSPPSSLSDILKRAEEMEKEQKGSRLSKPPAPTFSPKVERPTARAPLPPRASPSSPPRDRASPPYPPRDRPSFRDQDQGPRPGPRPPVSFSPSRSGVNTVTDTWRPNRQPAGDDASSPTPAVKQPGIIPASPRPPPQRRDGDTPAPQGPTLRLQGPPVKRPPVEGETPRRTGPILRDVGRKVQEMSRAPAALVDSQVVAPGGSPAPDSGRGSKGKGKSSKKFEREEVDRKTVVANRKANRSTRKAARQEAAKANALVKAEILEVGPGGMTVQALATQLAVNDSDVVRCLFMKGMVTTVNQTLDEETVRVVCKEYDVEVLEAGAMAVEEMAKNKKEFLDMEDLDNLHTRPPVVTIMGHVDHGKTSLLDYIRKSKVAASEAGGITQGIGAYRVKVPVGEDEPTCVFLDTPGHEAFSAMRARGARVTDIVILVVAADDGVRPQTQEAIAHAKAANVPIVVAINKMDKEGANPERVIEQLAGLNLVPESWGGDVPMVPVSALTGAGVDDLLENVMLLAMVQDLRANPDRDAVGTVIEASLDKFRGPVATLLVQNGTLRQGDVIVCGESYGKARALTDDVGARVDTVSPSTAVEVLGLSVVPVAGDEFKTVATLEEARQLAEECAFQLRAQRLAQKEGEGMVTLASVASAVAANQESGNVEHHTINIILKVDAQGTLEAIRSALSALPQDTVRLRFLLYSTGEITMSDVDMATASQAIIVGFNVPCSAAITSHAEDRAVEVRTYRVIYDLVDDVRKAMEGLLLAKEERIPLGQAQVKAVFGTGSSRVAGCMVLEGKLVKGCHVTIQRGGKDVFSGVLSSLRRVKEQAKEVAAGLECGVGVSGFDDWSEGDVVDAFNLVEKVRSLEEASKTNSAAISAAAY